MTNPREEALEWIQLAEKEIRLLEEKIQAGVATQLEWVGWSNEQMSLGRARFLHGDALPAVREAFQKAAQGVVMSFTMAYDASSPHFLGERSVPSSVSYTRAIDGFNAGAMAGDMTLTRRLAQLLPPHPPGSLTPKEVIHYVRGLQCFFLGSMAEAQSFVHANLERYEGRPPKQGYQRNFFSLSLTLCGVIEKDAASFNEGLRLQSQVHKGRAMGECADTPEEYICDHLVALGMLGLQRGLRVPNELPYLPKELLAE